MIKTNRLENAIFGFQWDIIHKTIQERAALGENYDQRIIAEINNFDNKTIVLSDGEFKLQATTSSNSKIIYKLVSNDSTILKIDNDGNAIPIKKGVVDVTAYIYGTDNYKAISKTIRITITAPEPVANYTASATSVKAGEEVVFTDTSANIPTTWAWKITKQGSTLFTSAAQHPAFTFAETGLYSVELTASNTAGSHTKKVDDMITVEKLSLSTDDFLKEKVVIYPNPSNGRVNLVLGSLNKVEISVIDIFRKTVYKKAGNLNTSLYSFDLKEASGVYFVIISSEGKKNKFIN